MLLLRSAHADALSQCRSVSDRGGRVHEALQCMRGGSSGVRLQLKKKGKRVCHACVCKKNAAAAAQQHAAADSARKEAMKDAFAVRLNSTPTHEAYVCRCCGSNAAVRFAPCVRCTVECCSLRCFDRHDCDAYLEAKQTMPTELVPEEDRFHSADEILSRWKELLDFLRTLPASVSEEAVEDCAKQLSELSALDCVVLAFVEMLRLPLRDLYSPCVCRPWWNPAASARVCFVDDIHALATVLIKQVAIISQICNAVVVACAAAVAMDSIELKGTMHGDWLPVPTIDRASPCFLPGRLTHKLTTLLRWILRAMGSEWVQAHFERSGDASKDAFGTLPTVSDTQGTRHHVGYLELPTPDTGLRTLVPLLGSSSASPRFCTLRQHLGHRMLSMVVCDGQLLLDRGLHLSATQATVTVCAVSGWTGNVMDSFSVAPAYSLYLNDEWLLRYVTHSSDSCWFNEELEARQRPDYFHLLLAIQQLIPEDEWPSAHGSGLFLATPQPGVEYELVELSLLESLVDAAAGNERAQLLLTHIESECARPISDVISAQKGRLAQMLEDQAAQLRIHAEAVKRAEMRGRLRGPATAAEDDGSAGSSTAASVSSSSASALAPTSAASSSFSYSSSSSSLLAADSAVSTSRASSSLPGPAYSWTQSREYAGLESLRAPGRKKYSTIMSAAKRLLYSLSPVSVNKRAGSHIVFHFASGAPATLVQKHAGARSKDSTAHTTRLFAQLSEVAMQQMGGAIEGAPMHSSASAGAGVRRLLQ